MSKYKVGDKFLGEFEIYKVHPDGGFEYYLKEKITGMKFGFAGSELDHLTKVKPKLYRVLSHDDDYGNHYWFTRGKDGSLLSQDDVIDDDLVTVTWTKQQIKEYHLENYCKEEIEDNE